MAKKIQPKSKEDLVNELKSLKEKLVNAENLAVAASAVEDFAKKHGVDFVANEGLTKEDYIAVVDQIIDAVVHKKDLAVAFAKKLKKEKKELIAEKDGLIKSNADLANKIQAAGEAIKQRQSDAKTIYEQGDSLARAEKRIVSQAEKIEGQAEELGKRGAQSEQDVYSKLLSMTYEAFNNAGYKNIPKLDFSDSSNNNKKDFEVELFKAVRKAQASDKKAKKNAVPVYSPSGYKTIVDKIASSYEEYAKTQDPEVIKNFEEQYASAKSKENNVVTPQEIVNDIIDRNQARPWYLKWPTHLALTLGTIALVVLIIVAGSKAYQKDQVEKEMIDNEIKFSEVVDSKDTTIKDLEEDIADKDQQLSDAKQEIADKEQEIEDVKEQYVKGDVVTVDTTSAQAVAEFNVVKDYLSSTRSKAEGIISCQYNKNSGVVDLLLSTVDQRKNPTVTHISFTLDIANLSEDIKNGEARLDLSSIIDFMKQSDQVSRVAYQQTATSNSSVNNAMSAITESKSGETVLLSCNTVEENKKVVITYTALIVSKDAEGNVVSVEKVSETESYFGAKINLGDEQAKVKNQLLEKLGIEVEDEIEAE